MSRFSRHAALLVTLLALFGAALGGRVTAQPVTPADPGQAALDKLAIMELAARFEITFDAGDIDGHLDTWVDDLTFESPFGDYRGKDTYRAWVEEFNRVAMAGGGTRHLVTNFAIEVTGDSATMTCYLVILGATMPPAIGFTTVFTDDRLRRVDGEWKFVHRTLEVDQALPAADCVDATPSA